MSHTKGKLAVIDDGSLGSIVLASDLTPIGHTFQVKPIKEDIRQTERTENARRLVACWNACEGIDTDVLEKGRVSPDAFRLEESRADQAERKCDKLLAALQGVVRVADRKTEEFDAARAAIGEATGN